MNYKNAVILMILASIFWGLNGIFIRQITSFTSIGITISRLFLAAVPFVFLTLFHTPLRQQFRQSFHVWKPLCFISFLMAATFVFSVLSYNLTYIATAQTLNSIGMFFVVFFSPIFLKESVSSKTIVGMCLTFLGVVLILGIDSLLIERHFLLGDLVALAASVCSGLYSVFVKKFHLRLPFCITMLWIFGGAFLWTLLIAVVLGLPMITGSINMTNVVNIFALGIFGTCIAHTILNQTIPVLRPEKALTISLLSGVFAFLFGFFFLQEIVTIPVLIGIGLTLSGIFFVLHYDHRYSSR